MPDTPTGPSEPSKKYWWLVGIVVPIVVAIISNHSHNEGQKPPPVVQSSQTNASNSGELTKNLAGTNWVGVKTHSYTDGTKEDGTLDVTFNPDGTALMHETFGPSANFYIHERITETSWCAWQASGGETISVQCSYFSSLLTNSRQPEPPYSHSPRPRMFELTVKGSSIDGSTENIDGSSNTHNIRLARRLE